ncbi:hypothetical protein [Streptomyces avermitilis]|uniref:hypothetical protein n=1 Tax=Streptomyces avermitilis TaxID=33903 RepID=UPI00340B042D
MQTETLVGLIGFGGAVVGAGGALLGGWLQQRHQAETARLERQNARGYAAGEKSLGELHRLRHHLTECEAVGDVSQDRQPWRSIAVRHLDDAELAIMLIPNATQVRERLVKALYCARRYELAGQHRANQVRWIKTCVTSAIDMLSSHLRGDPVPPIGLQEIRNTVRRNDENYRAWDPRPRR